MPSKNMLPKGHRRQSVRAEYRATRGVEAAAGGLRAGARSRRRHGDGRRRADLRGRCGRGRHAAGCLPGAGDSGDQPRAGADADRSRAGPGRRRAAKGKHKLHGGEAIEIEGEPHPEPLHATPEDIPLDILYEDKYLAVVNKPAGMMVHAGAGSTDDARNRGHAGECAAAPHGASSPTSAATLRPGIVHRLDKQTSGAIVVAKDDVTHRKLGEMFADAPHRKDLPRAGARQSCQGQRHGESADRTRSRAPHAHDHAPARRAQRGLAYPRAGAAGDALWRVHAGRGADRDRAHPPDPRAYAVARPSCCRRHAVRRAAFIRARAQRAKSGIQPKEGGCSWSGTFSMQRIWSSPIPQTARHWRLMHRCRRSWRSFSQWLRTQSAPVG